MMGSAPFVLSQDVERIVGDAALNSGDLDQAIAFYKKSAELDDAQSLQNLWKLLLNGSPDQRAEGLVFLKHAVSQKSVAAMEEYIRILLERSENDPGASKEALALAEEAARLPDAKECFYYLGMMAAKGIAQEQNLTIGVAYLRQGEAVGSEKSLLALSELYSGSGLIEPDFDEAKRLAELASERGSLDARYHLALLCEKHLPESPDYEAAERHLRLASDRGNLRARYHLACYALDGRAGSEDVEAGVQLLLSSALGGEIQAARHLGQLYSSGHRALVKDPVAAAAWYRRASESGDAFSQNELGTLLLAEANDESDFQKVAELFRSASDQGLAAASFNLGHVLSSGVGVPKDLDCAFGLYLRAAETGHLPSMREVSRCYRTGAGVSVDTEEAQKWTDLCGEMEAGEE